MISSINQQVVSKNDETSERQNIVEERVAVVPLDKAAENDPEKASEKSFEKRLESREILEKVSTRVPTRVPARAPTTVPKSTGKSTEKRRFPRKALREVLRSARHREGAGRDTVKNRREGTKDHERR